MTENNSGGVAKYDRQPMPKRHTPQSQFDGSLDEIVTEEPEQPIEFPRSNSYSPSLPENKYASEKYDLYNNPIIKELMDTSGLSADEIMNGNPEMVRERLGIRNTFGEKGYWDGVQYRRFVTNAEKEALMRRWLKKNPEEKK